MISMLILTLVCVAWLEIIGIQSARKEARRREAVERLAGMMDAFMYIKERSLVNAISTGFYERKWKGNELSFEPKGENDKEFYKIYENDDSTICYQLLVKSTNDLQYHDLFKGWGSKCRWLIGRLYSKEGGAAKLFYTLQVCLGSENQGK